MKAGVLYAPNDIRYDEIELPCCSDDDVLVKVKYTGICGSDIPRVLGNASHFYPNVLGHEFVGVVERVGKNVSKVAPGDKVSGIPLLPCMECEDCKAGRYSLCKHYKFIGSSKFGSFAEYVAVPQTNVEKLMPDVSFEQGALFEPATIALHGILKSNYQGGKRVAVLGSGTIGMFVMQWAKIYGAKSVVMFDVLEERLKLATEMGATSALNSFSPTLQDEINKETDHQGFDYVFETSGVDGTMHMAMEIAGNCATVCYIGTPKKELTFAVSQWELLNRKELHLVGSWMSYGLPFPGQEWDLTAHFFHTGALKTHASMIDSIMPLSQIGAAFERFKTPGAVKGKILIDSEA